MLWVSPQLTDEPEDEEDDGYDPEDMKEDAGDCEGELENGPQDEQKDGEAEKFHGGHSSLTCGNDQMGFSLAA